MSRRKPASEAQERRPQTNVVTLVTSRLADRLADVAGLLSAARRKAKSSKGNRTAEPESERASRRASIKPAEQAHFFGQKRAVAKIRAALAAKPGSICSFSASREPVVSNSRQALAAGSLAPAGRRTGSTSSSGTRRRERRRSRCRPERERAFVREVREAIDKA